MPRVENVKIRTSCKICKSNDFAEIEVRILGELRVSLRQCTSCWCAFYDNPTWLVKSYQKPITDLDTGILQRADDIANVLTPFVLAKHNNQCGLDFGGGYGLLARKLRDRGFDWRSIDPKVNCIFAEVSEIGSEHFGVVSVIEVLEHLTDPFDELRRIAKSCDMIYISTLLIEKDFNNVNWWYLQLETGQHIFFLSLESLHLVGKQLKMHVYTNEKNLHVLSHHKLSFLQRWFLRHQRISWVVGLLLGTLRRRRSLSRADYLKNLRKLNEVTT